MGKLSGYRAPLKAPFTVCFWVTDHCQLSCRYCYAASDSKGRMDSSRLLVLVDEMAKLGVFDLVLAGGEPFLHPDIFTIIDYFLSTGIQTAILTNGIALDHATRAKLSKVVGKRKSQVVIQVSLDSPDPAINDQTRGQGVLVSEHIRELARDGFIVQLSCVLSTLNLRTAHQLIDAFYPDVKRYHFINIQRTLATQANANLLLTEEQTYEFWMRLWEHSKNFPDDLALPSLRTMLRMYGFDETANASDPRWKPSFSCASCAAGLTHINIDSDFNVLGCDIAKDFTFMGNTRTKSFEKVWHSLLAHRIRTATVPACHCMRTADN